MFGFGLAGDEVKVSKNDGRAVVSDGEVGGFEVEDGLVSFGADNEVEGDFIDGGVEVGGCGRLRGSLGAARVREKAAGPTEQGRRKQQTGRAGWLAELYAGCNIGPEIEAFS